MDRPSGWAWYLRLTSAWSICSGTQDDIARLPVVRVRTLELRLVAIGLTALWSLGAVYVLLGYRPGGPIDGLVGALAMVPAAIAFAGIVWPPVMADRRAFLGMIWLGLAAVLLLVPSIGGVLGQLLARGPQTLLPSVEAAYPWLLALAATSLFSELGVARRLVGDIALSRARVWRGALIAVGVTLLTGTLFTSAAVANDVALRNRPATSSRFGPTGGDQPPQCGTEIRLGASARLDLRLSAVVDNHSVGVVQLVGSRAGADVRWTADVASELALGRFGVARVGDRAWTLEPGRPWLGVDPAVAAGDLLDAQVLAAALTGGVRATADDRGLEFVEGARARHCRVAIDGPTFLAAFPETHWLTSGDTLRRWRGELDYWLFSDGELGQVTGSISGPARGLGLDGIQGTIAALLTATDRDDSGPVIPPVS